MALRFHFDEFAPESETARNLQQKAAGKILRLELPPQSRGMLNQNCVSIARADRLTNPA